MEAQFTSQMMISDLVADGLYLSTNRQRLRVNFQWGCCGETAEGFAKKVVVEDKTAYVANGASGLAIVSLDL